MKTFGIILATTLLTVLKLHAQLVADGATNTLSNVTNVISGNMFVGTNGSFTLLVLSNNGLLTNSATGYIGFNTAARSNEARLVSPSARWFVGGGLVVGYNGAFNRLTLSNGAQVTSLFGELSGNSTSATNNTVIVTGAGSVWSNAGNLNLGNLAGGNRLEISDGGWVGNHDGTMAFSANTRILVTGAGSVWNNRNDLILGLVRGGNQMVISNGGTVFNRIGYLGQSARGSNNLAVVTGAGSVWASSSDLYVGVADKDNQLVVSNGGAVFSSSGILGNQSTGNDNRAVVAGAGSLWHNTNNLSVGVAGARNQLIVTNGGTVSGSNIVVGSDGASFANRVLVDGGTLQVASASGAGALDVRRGTNVLNAGLVDVDQLVLTNALGVFEFSGGTLITRGAFITNGSGMVVGGTGANPAVWDVRPGATDHVVALGVLVGFNSSFNQLLVSDGAVLSNGISGFVGAGAANSNSASISGAGSRWQVAGEVASGAGGAFNQLTVSAGGLVKADTGRVGGAQLGSSNNLAVVTGAGSVWSNATSLVIGDVSPGNQLLVGDGGVVFAGGINVIGQSPTAVGNTVTVSDVGTQWRIGNALSVGGGGSSNMLVVRDGALVSDYHGFIGQGSGGSNLAIVTGAGSLWTNTGYLYAGVTSRGNLLIVSNSGVAASFYGTVGGGGTDNRVIVTDPGSAWTMIGSLMVGNPGDANRVEVRNGGLLASELNYIGANNHDSNSVLVTGAGSVWSNRLGQTVGFAGRRNELVVSDGASVYTGTALIGEYAGGNSNTVTVTGAGSRWLIATNLYVGSNAACSRLVVSNGGFVSSRYSAVGAYLAASNSVLVTGTGSVWTNSGIIDFGLSGASNQLVVSEGGRVECLHSGLGLNFNSSNNLAVITGPGSHWRSDGEFWVGGSGSINRLVLSNGGAVIDSIGYLGAASDQNELTVAGTGSLWSNRLQLAVGYHGSDNRLTVTDGGTVSGSNVFVGFRAGAINNRAVVNGGTLRATAADGTGVLDVRRGTNILSAGLVEVDQLILTNKGATPAALSFGNSGSNNIPGSGLAAPSTITVTGLAGVVTRVAVTLSNLTHTIPDDLDILLVGPAGQKVKLMSDAGGLDDVTDLRLTFDDAGPLMPDATALAPVTYRPTDYESGESLSSPAPPGPYSTSLSSFNGSSPNGVWTLYIDDDNFVGGVGYLRGWGLQFFTDSAFVDSGAFELNGGTLLTRGAVISNTLPFVVGGPGGVPAVWELLAGPNHHLVASDVIVGSLPAGSSNNLLRVSGGTLQAGLLDIRGGTNRLDAGLQDVDRLVVTNTRGQFELNGGTLRTPDTTVANGRIFTTGNGTSIATLQLLGGTHSFANNLVVASNASLIGNGVIAGTVTVAAGGKLTPGAPIGRMDVLGTLILQGAVNLQIDKSGGIRTNDQVTASGAIFYSGALTVTDIGADALAAGDRFVLFNATPYIGGFNTITLPPLDSGLAWVNKLLVDGSIEVVVASQSQPKFSSVVRSGTNLILSGTNGVAGQNYAVLTATNVTTPATNWQSLFTNQFGAGGQFSFTNGILSDELQRYFRIRTP